MYSLSISFGPTGTVWQFLFKEKEAAQGAHKSISENIKAGLMAQIQDDYGQIATFGNIHGYLLEDLPAVETARIQRSLIDERCKAKFIKAATDDPTIKAAMRPQGPSVLTPMGGGRFGG
jgi:hypothetical protein